MILSKRRRVRTAVAKHGILGDYKPMAEPDISLLQTKFQRLLDGQAGLMAELHEIKQLTTSIERHIAGIERRLDLTDA